MTMTMPGSLLVAFLAALQLIVHADCASAQDGSETERIRRDSPRATMLGYLEACRAGEYARAAEYLDLAPVPAAERPARGPELARQLKAVLDTELWVDVEALSEEPEGHRDDGLPARRDRIGTIQAERGAVEIWVDRARGPDGQPIWRVSSVTVARIPDLYREFGPGFMAEHLPSPLVDLRIFEIALWQWLGLALALFAAYLVAWALAGAFARAARPIVARSATDVDDRLLALTTGPLRLLLTLLVFAAGSAFLALSIPARRALVAGEMVIAIFAVTWLLWRLVDLISKLAAKRLSALGREAATHVVPLGARAIKGAVAVLAVLAALDSFGFDVTALIAGLGVGGIAVALAAQKTLENVFGGITILADQPVRPGEFCRYGDKIGTVEEIGLRSTRVRSLDRTLVSVPNAEFSTLQIENFAARDRILLMTTLGLRYETTPDQLRYVLVGLRRLLYAHPRVLEDPARVRFAGFGAFSLDLEVFCYVDTGDWNEFLAVREDVFLRMMEVIDASGTGFAFPSQTAYLAQDAGVDAQKTDAAEAQVAEWRRQSDLMLPNFTAERIAALDDSLDYPARGSAMYQDTGKAERGG